MLKSGTLRHRVDIEQQVHAQNPQTGEMVTTWSVFAASIPASIEPLSAREFIQAAATQSSVTARVVIRYLPGVTAAMRVRHGTQLYNIHGVLADKVSGQEYMTLPVSEGLTDGQ
jgi:SPP1 family predicted phage head-tail adaptor